MGILDIYLGHQTWSDYAASQPDRNVETFSDRDDSGVLERHSSAESSAGSIAFQLSPPDHRVAIECGLGAVESGFDVLAAQEAQTYEISASRLGGGLDRLGADFNLLMGDLVWKLQLGQESLKHSLLTIRMPVFERESGPYRTRAERAYFNCWYEEALADFLEAEKRNYPDFSIHRSIGVLYLYHVFEPTRALEYFCKTAKYSRPLDKRHSAEAHYFAAVASLILHRLTDAESHLTEAIKLNPRLLDAYYHLACIGALDRSPEAAMASLEPAIMGDPRYFERAQRSGIFEGMEAELSLLLDRLVQPAREKADLVKHDAEQLRQYVLVSPRADKIFRLFDEIKSQMSGPRTQMARPEFLETLSSAQKELAGIYESFTKQYEIEALDYVRSITFSPDGRLLATGFLHGAVTVWDVDGGLEVMSLIGHLASVNSVVFSPDSHLLATASRDKTIKLWEISTGRALLNFLGHTDEVTAVAFSPDGRWLASAGHDRTVRIWRVETGREVQILMGHTNKITSAVFSPDGRLLATGSSDQTVRLWDISTGLTVLKLKGHTKGVASLAFSPDGRLIAAGGDDTTVRVWEVASGKEWRTLKGHRYSVTSVAFDPTSRLLAAGSLGQTIVLWRLETASQIESLRFTDISYNSVAFSPGGEWLALGSREVQLWLKAVLTYDQYSTIKDGLARGLVRDSGEYSLPMPARTPRMSMRAASGGSDEGSKLARAWTGRRIEAGARNLFASFAEPVPRGFCEVCSIKLGKIERIFHDRCKLHR